MYIKIFSLTAMFVLLSCSGTSSKTEEVLILSPSSWDKICDEVFAGEKTESTPVIVIQQTRPVYDFDGYLFASFGGTADSQEIKMSREAHDLSLKFYKEHVPVQIQMPEMTKIGTCQWVGGINDLKNWEAIEDQFVLEISNLVKNPLDGKTGIFLRISLSGINAATWHWANLKDPGTQHELEILEIRKLPTVEN